MNDLLTDLAASLSLITPPLAVAVSGGADSMALLLLAHQWARQRGGEVIALTVDHGLRSDSAEEARRVQGWILEKGIKHVILKWEGEKPPTRLHEKAREARYDLMLSWCKNYGILSLLLGHHAQDQEETFWLRLAAGSGLTGLAGMKTNRQKDRVTLLRPLLKIQPEKLKEFLRAENQDWIEDPSNKNERFFRGRFRSFLKEEGLSSERLLKTMEKFREDADFIQEALDETLKRLVKVHKGGYVSVSKKEFETLHPALAKRVMTTLMQWFSKNAYPPRSEQVQGVLEKLKTGRPFTAGGIYWFYEQDQVYLSRELKAVESPLLLQAISEKHLWDQRFWIDPAIKTVFPEAAYLAPLKRGGEGLSAPISLELPRRIRPSLPAIWIKEEVVAIPHLCYSTLRNETNLEKFISLKPFFHNSLRFTI